MATFSLLPKRKFYSSEKTQVDFSIWINLEDEIRKDAEQLGWIPQELIITVLDQFLQALERDSTLQNFKAAWKPSIGSHVMNLQFPRRLRDELVTLVGRYNDHNFGLRDLIVQILCEYVAWRKKITNE